MGSTNRTKTISLLKAARAILAARADGMLTRAEWDTLHRAVRVAERLWARRQAKRSVTPRKR